VQIEVRPAGITDAASIAAILHEAHAWLQARDLAVWQDSELTAEAIERDIHAGHFHLAFCNGEPAGTIIYQIEDREFWPEASPGDAAYLHRMAVLRRHAGGAVSAALLRWAVARARAEGYRLLRLDCLADRPRLRAMYEHYGFRYHSDRVVPPYHVARYELSIA
jgi:GNAT superfamily N-acetyltransferase